MEIAKGIRKKFMVYGVLLKIFDININLGILNFRWS
ncbi:hypothetical protein ES708_11676 [subsurface metagenome]